MLDYPSVNNPAKPNSAEVVVSDMVPELTTTSVNVNRDDCSCLSSDLIALTKIKAK